MLDYTKLLPVSNVCKRRPSHLLYVWVWGWLCGGREMILSAILKLIECER